MGKRFHWLSAASVWKEMGNHTTIVLTVLGKLLGSLAATEYMVKDPSHS